MRIRKIIDNYSLNSIKISVAESCTGGFISHMITNVSGASKIFDRGIVCYSNEAKIELLGVNSKDINKYGAVSEQVAKQLAEGIRKISNSDIGIGITGIAGPTGGTPQKPVGTVFISFSTENEIIVKKFQFKNCRRIEFKQRVLDEVLNYLEDYI
ncbi:MAG: CinA family protein [Promethearchaeota archaeon]